MDNPKNWPKTGKIEYSILDESGKETGNSWIASVHVQDPDSSNMHEPAYVDFEDGQMLVFVRDEELEKVMNFLETIRGE